MEPQIYVRKQVPVFFKDLGKINNIRKIKKIIGRSEYRRKEHRPWDESYSQLVTLWTVRGPKPLEEERVLVKIMGSIIDICTKEEFSRDYYSDDDTYYTEGLSDEAIQFSGFNGDEIHQWCGGEITSEGSAYSFKPPDSNHLVDLQLGDFVVVSSHQETYVCQGSDFHLTHDLKSA